MRLLPPFRCKYMQALSDLMRQSWLILKRSSLAHGILPLRCRQPQIRKGGLANNLQVDFSRQRQRSESMRVWVPKDPPSTDLQRRRSCSPLARSVPKSAGLRFRGYCKYQTSYTPIFNSALLLQDYLRSHRMRQS